MTHDGEPDSYEYASRLATWIWEKHYKNESPHWKPLNDLLGVLTQIDNMTTGLVRAQPEQEPVAWELNEVILDSIHDSSEVVAPPQREWQRLTENEIKHLWYEACQTNLELTSQLIVHLARNIEAKLKEKNSA